MKNKKVLKIISIVVGVVVGLFAFLIAYLVVKDFNQEKILKQENKVIVEFYNMEVNNLNHDKFQVFIKNS